MQANLSKKQQKILVLGTGGTIAGLASSSADAIGYTAGQVDVGQLLQTALASADAQAESTAAPAITPEIFHEQLFQIDSKDINHAHWLQLAQRCQLALDDDTVRAIVITHGTDTLEETAFFLHSVLRDAADDPKPIVLTCAMRPASSADADGPHNLKTALQLALHADVSGLHGVVVVCADNVYSALDVQKISTIRKEAFNAGDAAPLAVVEPAPDSSPMGHALRQLRPWVAPHTLCPVAHLPPDTAHWPVVDVVLNHANAGDRFVNLSSTSGAHGIVVAATGNGTVNLAMQQALQAAQTQGVQVVISTRCSAGRVFAPPNAPLPTTPLQPVKARIALLLQLLAQRAARSV